MKPVTAVVLGAGSRGSTYAEFAKEFQFFPQSGLAVFDVENCDEGMIKTMKLLSDNGIAASRIQTTSPTLEQIYIQTVADGANGRGNL